MNIDGNEVALRYGLFRKERNEWRELDYQSLVRSTFVERNRSPAYAPQNTIGVNKPADYRRYFPSFYASFLRSDVTFFDTLVKLLFKNEAKERQQLQEQEMHELILLCRGFGSVLGCLQPQLLCLNTLTAVDEESVARRLLQLQYYHMIAEACQLEEELTRRLLVFAAEPEERRKLVISESALWIESRKLQVQREECETLDERDGARRQQIEYFKWRQKQQYQLFHFQQGESQGRIEVERAERLSIGIIAGMYNSEYKEARYRQLEYEVISQALSREASLWIAGDEASFRSQILLEQLDAFRIICANEVRSFLATHRYAATNAYVDRM